jgi:HEAT repeat protein
MATKRPTRKHPPKAVELHFDERMPRQPAVRRSRPLRGASMTAARIAVENVLRRRHGPSDAAIRKLSPDARKILFRIVADPSDLDHVWRRDAVSALAALGTREATMLLASLATDTTEDAVITGRALNGLAKLGGEAAAGIIERSMERRDEYVRTAALKALMKLDHSSAIPALTRAAKAHPSPLLRARAERRLAELGAPIKAPRRIATRNSGVLVRDARSR